MARTRFELERLFDKLLGENRIPKQFKALRNEVVSSLTHQLGTHQKQLQFSKLSEGSKCLLLYTHCLAKCQLFNANSPRFDYLIENDKILNLLLMPKNQLTPQHISELKKLLQRLRNDLSKQTDNRMKNLYVAELERRIEDRLNELDSMNRVDPRPLGADPIFANFFLDYETLTNISYYNMDPKTGMYQTNIPKIILGANFGLQLGAIQGTLPIPLETIDVVDAAARGERHTLDPIEEPEARSPRSRIPGIPRLVPPGSKNHE